MARPRPAQRGPARQASADRWLLAYGIEAALAQGPAAQGAKTEVILKSGKTVDGELVHYPAGKSPEITSAIVTLEPGGRTALHQHPVPVVAYILEGTLTVKEEG